MGALKESRPTFAEAATVAIGLFLIITLYVGFNWLVGNQRPETATMEILVAGALGIAGVGFRNRLPIWFSDSNFEMTFLKAAWGLGALALVVRPFERPFILFVRHGSFRLSTLDLPYKSRDLHYEYKPFRRK